MNFWQKLGLVAAISGLMWITLAENSQAAAVILSGLAFLLVWNWPRDA